MNFKKLLLFLFLTSVSLNLSVFGSDYLKKQDVDKIMNQIMQQHVDKKQMSDAIIKKAFVIYIDQFDPDRSYLLSSEVQPFTQMSESDAAKILTQYKNNDFSTFEKLNATIQKSIQRARESRKNIALDKSIFVDRKTKFSHSGDDSKSVFAQSESELRGRVRDQVLKFIDAERKRYGQAQVLRNESQLMSFYEKEVRNHEDSYLATNEKGQPLPPEVRENLFVMHVLKALASSLDAHTSFFNSAEAYDMKVRLEKEFQGVGITMQEKADGVYVTALVQNGPADKSGQVKLNDRVLEIDGKSITGEAFEKIQQLIRGKAGTSVTLLLQRQVTENNRPVNKEVTVKLTREEITVNDDRVDVTYEKFGNGIIGKITLHSFYQSDKGISSEKDVKAAIKKLQEMGNLRGLVLDLRENSGGFLNQAVKVAGLFISNGVIVISKYSNGDEKFYRDMDSSQLYDGPMIVLTSKATASAAEIVAQALQDYGVAVVVGDEHTYGKGTIQSQTVTDNQGGSYFKVTVGKYYTVSGKTPQITGVKSDIVVPSQYNQEHIGEEFLEYPLHPDVIPAAFDDKLADIDPSLKPWYLRYYTPSMQHRKDNWDAMVPVLKKNSEYRLAHNKNFQMFLKKLNGQPIVDDGSDDEDSDEVKSKKNFGKDDLQMAEAVNIVKDMVYLQTHNRRAPTDVVETNTAK